MQMNRLKWTRFPALGIAIIIFAPAATPGPLEETSLRCKIVKMVRMEGSERETSPTAVEDF
jgi:hypothetical protein